MNIKKIGKNFLFLIGHTVGIIFLFSVLLFVIGPETPYSNFFGGLVHAYVFTVAFMFIRRQLFPDVVISDEIKKGNMPVAVFFGSLLIALALIFQAL